jgi:hypothetical protein
LRYLQWLTTPKSEREPKTQQGLADEIGCHVRSLRDWQQDPLFREAWEREAKAVVGTPERAQAVLDTLYAAAVDPANRNQVQAAKLYLEATNSIKPPPVEVKITKPSELSDEELDELLALGAVEVAQARRAVSDVEDRAVSDVEAEGEEGLCPAST